MPPTQEELEQLGWPFVLQIFICFLLAVYFFGYHPYVMDWLRDRWHAYQRRRSLYNTMESPAPAPLFVAPPPLPPQQGGELSSLAWALQMIPQRVLLSQILHSRPRSTTALPLGVSDQQQLAWLDLATETLHIGLYAASGAGKDNLLRAWFLTLAFRNSPERVQFAIIDGKGDWLTSDLARLAHMFTPPAGGYGRQGDAAILKAIKRIDAEAERRQNLITRANCITREQYVERTGRTLPLLVVVATDVMTSVSGEVEALLVNLVSKARSLGIRVIVSMQTPTGKATQWRVNLSTVVVGALQSGEQDRAALGIDVKEMRYRPSRLPSPQERPGLFVARRGAEQMLVQAPYVEDALFAQWVPHLPQREVDDDDLVAGFDIANSVPTAAPRVAAPRAATPRAATPRAATPVSAPATVALPSSEELEEVSLEDDSPEEETSMWSEQHVKVAAWLAAEPDISIREVARRIYPGSDGSGRYSIQARLLMEQVRPVLEGVNCERVNCERVNCERVNCGEMPENEPYEGDSTEGVTVHTTTRRPVSPDTNGMIQGVEHSRRPVSPDTNGMIQGGQHSRRPVSPDTNGMIQGVEHSRRPVSPDTNGMIQGGDEEWPWQETASTDIIATVQVITQIQQWDREGLSRNQMCQRLGGNRNRAYALIRQALGAGQGG